MKTILLISALVLSAFTTTQAQAQPWATAGATWHYSVQGYAREGYMKLTNIGDTILNGKSCNVLEKYTEVYDFINQNTITETAQHFTYIDSNKVYYYINNNFSVLYDFNASTGNYWVIEDDSAYYGGNNCSYKDTVMVDSTIIVIINGTPLRKLYTHTLHNSIFFGNEIIEKIGNTTYFFPTFGGGGCGIITEISYGPLRCYTDSAGFNYQTNPSTWGHYGNATTPCDFVTATREQNKALEHINAFPNPTATTLTINTTANISTVRMYNALGQQVINNVYTTASNTQTIPVNTLPNGIYVLQVSTVNNSINTTKVVVQE
ncbi:MAG: T9SS type A sorting domain-containing protein [Bacteroidia bacterium]